MKKVLIADDHAIFREGLKQVIAITPDMVVADEAETGEEALRKVRENDYDLVILDISMPGRDGLGVLADIKRIKPKLPVLMLSMHPEEHYALRAYKTGAIGYLAKGGPSGELLEALRCVSLGKRYISAAFADTLAACLGNDRPRPTHEDLSSREFQIMCMIANGIKPQQIAKDLAMSVKTVSTYRARIFGKLHFRTNADLTRYALENGLL